MDVDTNVLIYRSDLGSLRYRCVCWQRRAATPRALPGYDYYHAHGFSVPADIDTFVHNLVVDVLVLMHAAYVRYCILPLTLPVYRCLCLLYLFPHSACCMLFATFRQLSGT